MRLVTVLVASLAVVRALDYDQETGKVTLSIGNEAKVDLKLQLNLFAEKLLVFGPECKDAGSCTKEGHPVYDAAKDKVTLEDGVIKVGKFDTKLAKDVEVNTGDKTIKQDINVIVGAEDEAKQKSFSFEGIFGLRSGKDRAFDKLVSALDKKHLLIVPKLENDKKSKPELLLGSESQACGEFKLVETTFQYWADDNLLVTKNLATDFLIAPSFSKSYGVSSIGIALFDKEVLSEDEYNNLEEFNLSYGGVEIKFNPQDAFEQQKDKTYKLQVTHIVQDEIDLALPNSYFEKYCIKFAKDGDKYMVGLAERNDENQGQNGAGLVATSLAALMGMFSLLWL
ncbi:unnamed protein product [Bursaphelenchus okinawaensis]|uniref:Peptidase A1 domain-containing protein n=1 Tax=Bursaphelenchus okinawaensis TaxID=465554 RepID=A0A811L091_9BILA|nr:unnamed protein product [Bursaphelenchus okinawaensis]CAG9114397.1 unnamed protein product [Bursaphelenchus okinawaensis]